MRNAPKLPKVLRAVNTLRKQFGLKPIKALPKGIICEGEACPIFNALRGAGVSSVGSDCINRHGERIPLPAVLSHFIARFDNKKYPHLIEA